MENEKNELIPEQEETLSADDILLEEILREHREEMAKEETMIFQRPLWEDPAQEEAEEPAPQIPEELPKKGSGAIWFPILIMVLMAGAVGFIAWKFLGLLI